MRRQEAIVGMVVRWRSGQFHFGVIETVASSSVGVRELERVEDTAWWHLSDKPLAWLQPRELTLAPQFVKRDNEGLYEHTPSAAQNGPDAPPLALFLLLFVLASCAPSQYMKVGCPEYPPRTYCPAQHKPDSVKR